MSVFPIMLSAVLPNSNWQSAGSLSKGDDRRKLGLWSERPLVEFYQPTTVLAGVSAGQVGQYSSTLG